MGRERSERRGTQRRKVKEREGIHEHTHVHTYTHTLKSVCVVSSGIQQHSEIMFTR